MIRALIVGNSCVQRSELSEILGAVPEIKVAYSVRSSERAISRISTGDIDVVFLLLSNDDGLNDSFLSELSVHASARLSVIPVTSGQKIKSVRRLKSFGIRTPHYFSMPESARSCSLFVHDVRRAMRLKPRLDSGSGAVLRVQEHASSRPELVCVVASTGGPEALCQLLAGFEESFDLPILITQHMPETFIDKMCANLGRYANRPVQRAVEGAEIRAGGVYVAPGDAHLGVRKVQGKYLCLLDKGPPSAGCRPAGNVMLESAAKATLGRLVAVCLTGMGTDGTQGMACVRQAGGVVVVQDEASSVVWGMPGSIVEHGYENHVLPLKDLATKIQQLATEEMRNHVICAS